MQQSLMRKSQPLRWIEEAEARQVVTLAMSETPPLPGSRRPVTVPTSWIARLRRWGLVPAVAIVADEAGADAVVRPLRR
jgi:hypothetical protein